LKIAIITTDSRENKKLYSDRTLPLSPAVSALVEGLRDLTGHEFHIVACSRESLPPYERLGRNIEFHSVRVGAWGWGRTFFLGCVMAIKRELRQIGPDLVHGQGTERECALASALSGFPSIITMHGNMDALARRLGVRIGSRLWRAARLEAFALRRAHGVICNSRYTMERVACYSHRTWLVPNALRLPFFDPLPIRTRHTEKPTRLLVVGEIAEWKNQALILEAAQQLFDESYPLEWVFVGNPRRGSPYASRFLAKLQELSRAGMPVSHLVPMSCEEIVRLMDSSDALVHMPMEEAFGLVVPEAVSRGLQVFCAPTGGLADIAEGVGAIRLIDSVTPMGVCAGVMDWVRDGKPAADEASITTMRSRYHPGEVADMHDQIYRSTEGVGHRAHRPSWTGRPSPNFPE